MDIIYVFKLELSLMKRKLFTFLKKHLLLSGLLSLATLAICFVMAIYFVSFLLGPPSLIDEQKTVIDRHDQEVIGEENGAKILDRVSLDHISPTLIDATLAVEDRHFYQHHGFDIKRIFGAIVSNIKSFSLKEGASTISHQLARNLYLRSEEHTSELQSRGHLVCRLLLEKKKKRYNV